jgi:hypothetical protein
MNYISGGRAYQVHLDEAKLFMSNVNRSCVMKLDPVIAGILLVIIGATAAIVGFINQWTVFGFTGCAIVLIGIVFIVVFARLKSRRQR